MVCRVYRLFSAFEASDFSHALQMSLAALELELMRLTLRRTVDNIKKRSGNRETIKNSNITNGKNRTKRTIKSM